jgi:hypothetical protein
MKFIKLIVAAFAALVLSHGASAAVLLGTNGSGANMATDYSAPGLASFNLDLHEFSNTTLNFRIEQADLMGPLSLSAMVMNLTGVPITQFNFVLQGITFAAAGSVTPTFGVLGNVGFDSDSAHIAFSSAEPAEFHFGNPLGLMGQTDWLLDTPGLQVGDVFSITAQVPEPSTIALLIPMLCMASLMLARRSKND